MLLLMERQLVLLEPEPDWKLDEQTRAVGRAGLAEARQALQSALLRTDERAAGRVDGRKAA
jgi:hypothetical protein